eukprot:scaffold68028_cov27-Tisochrysis_lutea.AAC.1
MGRERLPLEMPAGSCSFRGRRRGLALGRRISSRLGCLGRRHRSSQVRRLALCPHLVRHLTCSTAEPLCPLCLRPQCLMERDKQGERRGVVANSTPSRDKRLE